MATEAPKILILYSCPADQDRIRLDKEHRAIEEILKKHKVKTDRVKRVHATSVADFAQCLREGDYDIVQFSGHVARKWVKK